MRRWWLALAPIAALPWVACGGGYGTDGTAPPVEAGAPGAGDRGGSCYPNRTCNETLTCIDSLCVLLDAGVPPSPPSADSGVEASMTVAPCPGVEQPFSPPGVVRCGESKICTGDTCCVSSNHPTCADNPPEDKCANGRFDCDTPNDCPASRCCLAIAPRAASSCPFLELRTSTCAADCKPTEVSLCLTDEDCGAGKKKCTATALALGSSSETVTVRLCE